MLDIFTQRLHFATFFYTTSVQPFNEIKQKIDAGEEPYVDRRGEWADEPAFIREFAGRILNIHPSLLPSFPGLHAQRQALAHGVRVTGCTVHLVDEGLDSGAILAQAAVRIEPDDDEDCLAARILEAEHQLYPEALRWFCEDRIEVVGRVARVLPETVRK